MDFSFLLDTYFIQLLLRGLMMTLLLAFIAISLGSLLSIIPAYLRLSKHKTFNFIGTSYVEIIRGTPLLVQALLVYSFFRLPVTIVLGIDISNFIPGMLALLINSSAYVSEILRGGILSVAKGQKEASECLGMSERQTMIHIIFPQAFKNMIQSLGNEFATMIKETSIFMYLGVAELMYSAQIVISQNYLTKEIYITVAALYFVLTFTTSKLMGLLERKLRKHESR